MCGLSATASATARAMTRPCHARGRIRARIISWPNRVAARTGRSPSMMRVASRRVLVLAFAGEPESNGGSGWYYDGSGPSQNCPSGSR